MLRQIHVKLSTTTIWSYLRWLRYKLKPDRCIPKALPQVLLETTNICNSKCVFCPYPIMERKKEPMSMELFKKAVDEIGAAGGNEVTFCVTMGDPLLDPHLLERARYVHAKLKPPYLGFLTTLQWLHRYDLDEFISLFKWVQVSTSLSGPESYKKFFGVDLYHQMLRNLEALIKRNKELGSPLLILFSMKPIDETEENIVKHPDFIRISQMTNVNIEAMGRDSATITIDDWNGAVKLPEYLKGRLGKIRPRAYLPCGQMYHSLSIASNGNVAPCTCRDYNSSSELVIGNVKTESLLEIWNGKKLKALRENWLKRNVVPPICQTCRFFRY